MKQDISIFAVNLRTMSRISNSNSNSNFQNSKYVTFLEAAENQIFLNLGFSTEPYESYHMTEMQRTGIGALKDVLGHPINNIVFCALRF